jgi:hypothetical protein
MGRSADGAGAAGGAQPPPPIAVTAPRCPRPVVVGIDLGGSAVRIVTSLPLADGNVVFHPVVDEDIPALVAFPSSGGQPLVGREASAALKSGSAAVVSGGIAWAALAGHDGAVCVQTGARVVSNAAAECALISVPAVPATDDMPARNACTVQAIDVIAELLRAALKAATTPPAPTCVAESLAVVCVVPDATPLGVRALLRAAATAVGWDDVRLLMSSSSAALEAIYAEKTAAGRSLSAGAAAVPLRGFSLRPRSEREPELIIILDVGAWLVTAVAARIDPSGAVEVVAQRSALVTDAKRWGEAPTLIGAHTTAALLADGAWDGGVGHGAGTVAFARAWGATESAKKFAATSLEDTTVDGPNGGRAFVSCETLAVAAEPMYRTVTHVLHELVRASTFGWQDFLAHRLVIVGGARLLPDLAAHALSALARDAPTGPDAKAALAAPPASAASRGVAFLGIGAAVVGLDAVAETPLRVKQCAPTNVWVASLSPATGAADDVRLLRTGTVLPARSKIAFTTVADDQREVVVCVGEGETAATSSPIAVLRLGPFPGGRPAGSIAILVSIVVDEGGSVALRADAHARDAAGTLLGSASVDEATPIARNAMREVLAAAATRGEYRVCKEIRKTK